MIYKIDCLCVDQVAIKLNIAKFAKTESPLRALIGNPY